MILFIVSFLKCIITVFVLLIIVYQEISIFIFTVLQNLGYILGLSVCVPLSVCQCFVWMCWVVLLFLALLLSLVNSLCGSICFSFCTTFFSMSACFLLVSTSSYPPVLFCSVPLPHFLNFSKCTAHLLESQFSQITSLESLVSLTPQTWSTLKTLFFC